MRIDVSSTGVYKILRITNPISIISDLAELRSLIRGYLQQGDIYLAISFTDASYLYSGAIAVLINCFKMVKEKGGDLCIIEPQPGLLDLLRQMGIDTFINIYTSEDDLPCDLPSRDDSKKGCPDLKFPRGPVHV